MELAHRITAMASEFRLTTQAGTGEPGRSVQVLEIAIDVLDMASQATARRCSATATSRATTGRRTG